MPTMTSKERMLVAMRGGTPDYVPVAPDMSNMIPCRLTRKPFWDIYLYQDPPLWKAYANAVRHFGIDGWQPSVPVEFDFERELREAEPDWQQAIVKRTPERIYTRRHALVDGHMEWSDRCNVYYIDNPPTHNLPLDLVGLPASAPSEWQDVARRNEWQGTAAWKEAYAYMGERGVCGISVTLPGLSVREVDQIYEYYDNPEKVVADCQERHARIVRRAREICKLDPRPDFLLIGMSGFMLANPEPIFRRLALPTLKEVTAICKAAGIPSQIHCCGPEHTLVKISAEESDLTSINPLEIPPMGDCILAEVKREFGRKLSLMGNLHTTEVMLMGSPADVERAAKQAIDDAGAGGGFILSTGDQCGRDTPEANIFKMVEVAQTYGKY